MYVFLIFNLQEICQILFIYSKNLKLKPKPLSIFGCIYLDIDVNFFKVKIKFMLQGQDQIRDRGHNQIFA